MTVAILGTGLIGASIGLALRRRSRSYRIIGYDSSVVTLREAKRCGAIGKAARSRQEAIDGAEIVILAAPVSAIAGMIEEVIRQARPSALVMDVAGVKTRIVQKMRRRSNATGPALVTGHPLAGSQQSGPRHARADLFEGRPFALYAPPQRARARALANASRLVRNLGAYPVIVKPQEHDRIVAATSALPQLTSVVLALAVDALAGAKAAKLTGPGLESGLRLAASPYGVWRVALAENSANVRAALRHFDAYLHKIMRALARGDDRLLARSFAQAASSRLRVLSHPGRRAGRH